MNRRDPNITPSAGKQPSGGYRSDESSWDSPRQTHQWQADANRQADGDWVQDDDQGTSHFGEGRARDRARPDSASRYDTGSRDYRGDDRRPLQGERRYRFSGESRSASTSEYPTHTFDASGGNDFAEFTGDDYGGRDFYNRGGGLTGGMRPSGSYRPSHGPGSWASSDDYGGWREYGERRGFLERAGDEIASWFGSEDATRRREEDHREDHRGRGPSDYTRSDERIREDVNDTLTNDWRIDASHVRVVVKDGEVTLEGTVSSRQSKRRAEDLADDITGVRHVQNNLRVGDSVGSTTTPSATTPLSR